MPHARTSVTNLRKRHYGGYGYGYRYNPGGLGGPYSGLGVRPGLGFGGFGLRR